MKNSQATIYEGIVDGVDYRLILNAPMYELYRIDIGYEDDSDVENGPSEPSSYFNGLELLSQGFGHTEGETEEAIERFIRCEVEHLAVEEENEAKLDY